MFHITIVDDNKEDLSQTTSYINQYFHNDHQQYTITSFDNGKDFLEQYNVTTDIIIFDIELPDSNGMDLAKKLREKDSNVIIIFTTKMEQFAAAGYDVDAIGYLVKPFSYDAFILKISKACMLCSAKQNITILVGSNTDAQYISSDDVQYIEVRGHEVIYHCIQGKYKVWGSLKAIAEKLLPFHFSYISRYTLVNLEYITEIHINYIKIGSTKLSLSRSKRKTFIDNMTRWYGR